MRNMLTALQVAQRLGVRIETVYQYVSRGSLRRQLADDNHSRFDPREVEVLARKGRPRGGAPRLGSIDVSLATSITQVAPPRVRYRGRDVAELARAATFEQVAELLWTASLPTSAAFALAPATARAIRGVRIAMPVGAQPIERLAAATAVVSALSPRRRDLAPAVVIAHARELIAAMASALPVVPAARAPAKTARIAAQLWPRLSPLAPTAPRVQLLDAALVLLADHELATSTMAARVAASTRADPFAVALAGLGAIAGPLHGAASARCHAMLGEARAIGGDAAVARAAAAGAVLGFGHPVYTGDDPRAVALLPRVRALASARDRRAVDDAIAAGSRLTGLPPNIDFAIGALAMIANMPPAATDAVFAIARTAGWIAHALEEYGEAPLRFRARAIYVDYAAHTATTTAPTMLPTSIESRNRP